MNSKYFITGLICLVIIVIPSNLFLKLDVSSAYVRGILVDYLIPKLYVSHILLAILSGIALPTLAESFKRYLTSPLYSQKLNLMVMASCAGVGVLLSQFYISENILSSMWYAGCIALIAIAAYAVYAQHSNVLVNWLIVSILFALGIQAILATYQIIAQQSLFPYYILGETHLRQYAGIAKATWQGVLYILPYGTMPHPNVLAGIGVLYATALTILARYTWHNIPEWVIATGLLIASYLAFITQSFSGGLSMSLLWGWYMLSTYKQSLLSANARKIQMSLLSLLGVILLASPIFIASVNQVFPGSTSINRRAYLQEASWLMWQHHPWLGVGLNTFTIHLETFSQHQEVVRFIQPVHHVGLLLLSETGLVGLLSFLLILYLLIHKKPILGLSTLCILSPIMALDHYLYTMPQLWYVVLISILLTRDAKNILPRER